MTILIAAVVAPFVIGAVVFSVRAPMTRLLPAYAALLPFGSGVALPGGLPPSYSSLSSLTALLLTVTLAVRLIDLRRFPRPVAGAAVWLMLLAVVGATTLWTVTPTATVLAVLGLAGQVALFVLLAASPVDRVVLRRTATGAVAGGVVACLYGIGQAVTGTLPEQEMSSPRFGTDLLGHNHVAAALLLPLAIALVRASQSSDGRARAGYSLSVAVLVTGIILTGSRTGLLCIALVYMVITLAVRRRFVLVLTGLVVAAGVAIVLSTNPGGFGGRQLDADSTGRSDIWQVGAAACAKHCIVGSGWGSFPEVYERTQPTVPQAAVQVRGSRYEPHNNWLLLAVESGVLGVVLFTVGIGVALAEMIRTTREHRAAPLAAVLGVVVSGMFLSNFEFKYFWFSLIFAMLTNRIYGIGLGLSSPLMDRRTEHRLSPAPSPGNERKASMTDDRNAVRTARGLR